MIICYYKTTPDIKKPTKEITPVGEPSMCSPYGDYYLLEPSFLISGEPPHNANFIYVDELDRYYIIKEVRRIAGNRCVLECKEDCLFTYWETIKTQNVTVSRNEYKVDNTIIDNMLPLRSEKQIILKQFGEPLQTNENYYILGVI